MCPSKKGKKKKKRKLNKYNKRARRGQAVLWAKKGNKGVFINAGWWNALPPPSRMSNSVPHFSLLKHAKRKILHRILKNFFDTTAAKSIF